MSRTLLVCLLLAVVAVSAKGYVVYRSLSRSSFFFPLISRRVKKIPALTVFTPVHSVDNVKAPGMDVLLFLEGFAVGIEVRFVSFRVRASIALQVRV